VKLSDGLLTDLELRKKLKCSRGTLYNYRNSGMPVEIGKRGLIRYDLEKVKTWINQQQNKEK